MENSEGSAATMKAAKCSRYTAHTSPFSLPPPVYLSRHYHLTRAVTNYLQSHVGECSSSLGHQNFNQGPRRRDRTPPRSFALNSKIIKCRFKCRRQHMKKFKSLRPRSKDSLHLCLCHTGIPDRWQQWFDLKTLRNLHSAVIPAIKRVIILHSVTF
jgi:hypothetical protein